MVRGSHVVAFAVGEGATDTDEEDRSQLFGDGALASLGIEVRVAGQQLFTVQELDIGRQEGVRSCSAQTARSVALMAAQMPRTVSCR